MKSVTDKMILPLVMKRHTGRFN